MIKICIIIDEVIIMLYLNANDRIENQPVIVRHISKKMGQNNKEYYHLLVSCGIKNYDAKIWRDDSEIAQEITQGCIASISGVAKDFKGNLQIHINKIERIDNPDDEILKAVLPSCSVDESTIHNVINSIIDTIANPHLHSLLNRIFGCKTISEAFYKKAAGIEIHHAYVGGLAQHTLEVTNIVISLCKIFEYIDYDMAVTASLLHDIGKIEELSGFPDNKYTDNGRLLGHIALGINIINETISRMEDFPSNLKSELEHCILSHHGTLEMGSPVLPMTLEAMAVHNADNCSATLNGFSLAIQRDTGLDCWTDYNLIYKRSIKKSL
jgi:3'-5' exoribonuclease